MNGKPKHWYPPVLAYHRVDPQPSSDTPCVRPESFERQMAILAERWKPVALTTLADWLEGNRPLPERPVAVTFDDGTADNYTHAFPILQKYRIPAAIFVIMGQVGQPGYLSASQIVEMHREGITFGSHCMDHEYLPSLPPDDLAATLAFSKQALEVLIGRCEFLSYPGGGYNDAVVQAAKKAGYRSAYTTNRGVQRFPPDRWAVRRVTIHDNAAGPAGLWLRCCGFYGLNRRLRAPA